MAAREELEIVTLQYPPYEYKDSGTVKGIAVDIVKEAFRRIKYPIRIEVYPWARAIKKIKMGDADAIFTAFKTPDRELFADYSNEILLNQVVSLYTLKKSTIQFDGDLTKLARYRFGIIRKVSYGEAFDNALDKGIISFTMISNSGESNFQMLILGRVDIVVSNRYGAKYILTDLGSLNEVKELHPPLQSIPSYIAFSKKRKLTRVRDKFDKGLSEMKKDGTYRKIIDNFQMHDIEKVKNLM
ncbi:substrate-binding periplasmic protein [Zooshikella harenae]|uniref:Transporter substrate-binding domain-containing protein n=1 Tax=Zooshikella harenae TaxID=2827238 RepID=A0ABS5ZKC8_9GAMM|nr:transporter substrate-binding domain-containing protein [Zooshikella harenae]MBU2713685.1 transporter substrate-binding domain-containing protein [Zooshikella harenae]